MIKIIWREFDVKMEHDFLIGTVRFNNATYLENLKWKQRKNHKGCAYGLNKPIAQSVPKGKYIYIIEMNNDINKIMGIGKIKNQVIHTNRSRMYKEERLNQFVYKSRHFISRNKIISTKHKAEIVLRFLENILFYGYKHFKRGQGCVILPWNRIITSDSKQSSFNKSNPKICSHCGKRIKGHICNSAKKNLLLLKFITGWFNNLF